MEPMDTSEPQGARFKEQGNCYQGVTHMPNSSHNMQTGSAPVSAQGSQHLGHPICNFTQMNNQAFLNSENQQMQNPPYPSGQIQQMQNPAYPSGPNQQMQNPAYPSSQNSQMQNQAFQNIQNFTQMNNQAFLNSENPQMQNSYPSGPNQQMQNSYPSGPNQQMQISAYPSGPNQQMHNPAYPSGPNQHMQIPAYPSGPNQQMQNPPYQSGPNQQMQIPAYPSGPNQQMQNPPYQSGPNQQMKNPAYPSGPNQQMQNPPYQSGPNQQVQNPGYPSGPNQQMQNPAGPNQQMQNPAGPNQHMQHPGYPSDPNQQMQNPGYPSGPNQQMQIPACPSGPNQHMQNPGYPSGPNQQVQNSGYPSGPNQQMQNPAGPNQQMQNPAGPNQQMQNPGYPSGPNQHIQNPACPSGPNQHMQNPGYPSGPNQQMQNQDFAICRVPEPQGPAASSRQTQHPVINSGQTQPSGSESYQLSKQNQSSARSAEHQASSDSKEDVDALIEKVKAENFEKDLRGIGKPSTTGYCKKMLSCHELPVDLNEDTLSNYVEVCGDCEVKKLEFSLDQTAALVTVDNEPDWEKLTKMSKTRQLENKKIRYERLLPSISICVLFDQADESNMQKLYTNLTPKPKDTSTVKRGKDIFHVITFSSPNDVKAVLRKKDQLAKEYKMLMSVYFESIGPVQEKSELVVEEEVELTVGQSRLLLTTKKLEEMRTYVDIEMKNERMIVMRGKPKAVSHVKVVIQDFNKQFKERKVECSMAKQKYIMDETCGQLMHLRMRGKNIEGTWYESRRQLMICATSDADLDHIANWIDRHLKEKIFDSTTEEFKQALKAMEHMKNGSYLLDYGNYHHELVLVAEREEFQEACQIVDGILAQRRDEEEMMKRKQKERSRTSFQESIKETIPKDHKLFLQRFKQKDLKALETKFNISIFLEGPDNEVIISGQVNKEALESFKAIVRDLKMAILALSPESSTQILSSGFLGCLEKYVGDTERCVISHKIQPLANESGDESLGGAVGGATLVHSSGHSSGHTSGHGYSNCRERGKGSSSPEPKIPKRVDRNKRTFQRQIQFIVNEGEIAKEKSDIIVNTVSKGFDLKAGAISKSLLAAGGWKFEKEFKEKEYKLHEGGFVVTDGGNLKCKHVFHCCLCPSKLVHAGESFQNVMSEMLEHADSLNMKTVSLPALGTGLLGYAPESSANIMFSAVMEYAKENKNIEEVRVVIYKSEKALKAFQDVQNVGSQGSDDGNHNQRGKKSIAKVKVGEIAKEKVDIIVNTSNSTLQLGTGAVSKSLLKEAGDKLQKECDKVMKKEYSLLNWQFVHTGPGNLDCNRVYHCNMPLFQGSTYELKKMVLKILETADKYKNESIAFPALGTGNLGYPRDEVAKALFDVVKDFQTKYPSSKLKDVRFVIYPKDEKSIQAFKEAERAVSGGRSGERSSGTSPTSPTPVVPPRKRRFKVGSIPVVVKQGDLSQESLEAVVNPMDASLSFKGNLYKALLKVGGKKFEDDTNISCDKLRRDGIASVQMNNDVTVVHIDRNKLRYGQKDAILRCLEYADSKDYKNIGFPIMQTGDAAEGMARDMFDAIRQFNNRRRKPTIIEEVYVVIYKMDQFHKFSDCLKRKCDLQPVSMTESETERGQITFTITSDEQPLILNAKKVLSEFCKDSWVVGMLSLPPSISKKNITAIGLQNDKVQIKDISKPGKKTLQIDGQSYDILKAINDFHRQFETEFADWEPDDGPDKFEESDVDENQYAGPLSKLPRENKSWSSPSTSSHVPVKPLHHSFTDKFESSSQEGASSINFQGKHFSDNKEESGHFGMDVKEERADQQSLTPFAMRWYYLDPEDDDLKEYDDDVSQKIEESYVKGKKEHNLPMDDNFEQYVVDFGAMEEYREKNREDSVMVLRREVVPEVPVFRPPKSWFPMDGKQLKVQMITTAQKEYENILRKIEDSVGSRRVTVLKIEQIQNVKTHERFEEKKLMLIRGGRGAEEELWFKCDKTDNIVPINHWGLSVTFTKGQHDSPLGEGVEFSRSFTDIFERGVKENQYAYLCNVLVGNYTKGQSGLRDPPCLAADESDFYHSVVDNVAKPSKYLVFSDAQIEPKYLVTFKLQT